MKLVVTDKQKKDVFLAIFQVLKGCTSLVSIIMLEDHVYVQGMDKAHVCLFDMKIMKDWFEDYEIEDSDAKNICFDSSTFHTILNIARDDQTITISYSGDADKLNIDLTSANHVNYDKYFAIPLTDLEKDILYIPDTEYEVDFTINSKKICEIMSQMVLFGTDIDVECSDEKVNLKTTGELGDMLVTISIDDLNEYSITENETIALSYSLTFIHKMCLSTKLATDITFSISKDVPMRISYDLGDESRLLFYLAPKCNI